MKGKVYIGHTPSDCSSLRVELGQILKSAGLEVLPSSNFESFEETKALSELSEANCSVHILGGAVGDKTSLGIPMSIYQIQEAIKQIGRDPNFKVFIWNVTVNQGMPISEDQQTIINNIRNNIVDNVVFTNIPSPVQLVDDIRSMLEVKVEIESEGDKKPVYVLYNFIDEDEAEEITDMLGDIMEVDSMIIGEEQNIDYGAASLKVIRTSELAVVFFSEASSWAIPFIQQVWKMSGGASSKTPLLLIGDGNNSENQGIAFNAPNVINKLVGLDLIPLEIKVTYDKLKHPSV